MLPRTGNRIATSLDALALGAARQWTSEPASLDDEPLRVHYKNTIDYRLDGDESDA